MTCPYAVISPDEQRRNASIMALVECQNGSIRGFISYPPNLNDVSRMLVHNFDVILVDLDSDPEYALDLVESISTLGVATAIVYSAQADPYLLVRCMRAGAREYLTLPFDSGEMADALVRASALRPAVRPPLQKKRTASCWCFWAPKAAPESPPWPAILRYRWPRSPGKEPC